ncbi:MAG: tyrosine-type recombinase/integrase [Thaumarchaeota archaeon]|nr:tyrosine-type recombinase/integrase [Nitrososphaerota archaeon]
MAEGFHERNIALIDEFLETLSSLSDRRLLKYRVVLTKMSRDFGKAFDNLTKDDLLRYVEGVNKRSNYSAWTKLGYRQVVKKFFGWLRDPSFVEWVKLGRVWSRVNVDDLLTDNELQAIRTACTNLRDRTLVETAYESAFRPHELLGLKKSSVVFDQYGASVYLENGKTGPRRVRVINAAPLLADWIANHPKRREDAPLWVDLSGDTTFQQLGYIGLMKLVKRIAKRAGVGKRVNPYVFRHTRLTHLSKIITESVLCEFAGWTQGSEMPRNYVHLSGRDVDEAILRAYGLIKPGEPVKPNLPIKCNRCGNLNPHESEICFRCGFALSERAAFKRDDDFQRLKQTVERMERRLGKLTS